MEGTLSRHHLFDPEGLAPAKGFSYGAVAAEGRLVNIAGITGAMPDGSLPADLVDQFRNACETVARVIEGAGGSPDDLMSMTIYTIDVSAYRAALSELGVAYRSVFDRHYPPMALIGVRELFDDGALVELLCTAVVPAR